MPGNSWRDLRPSPLQQSGPNNPGPRSSGAAAVPIEEHSPKLAALLDQRQQLEANMQRITGGANGAVDARDAARFAVPSFAERQAQQRQWEARRHAARQRTMMTRDSGFAAPEPTREPPVPPPRTGLRGFGESAEQWLDQRDQQRQRQREQARDRLAPLEDLGQPLRSLNSSLTDASSQLNELDRKLAAEGLDADRAALRGIGADKLSTAQGYLSKAQQAMDAPKRAVSTIDDFWRQRDNRIRGSMDQSGPYADRSRQRLSVDTGGSGDVFERAQRNRERALEQRRQQRQQEQRDQARRDRALRRRREQED